MVEGSIAAIAGQAFNDGVNHLAARVSGCLDQSFDPWYDFVRDPVVVLGLGLLDVRRYLRVLHIDNQQCGALWIDQRLAGHADRLDFFHSRVPLVRVKGFSGFLQGICR
ncbi:hypothetical protein D9M71_707110 [compost metagenome]